MKIMIDLLLLWYEILFYEETAYTFFRFFVICSYAYWAYMSPPREWSFGIQYFQQFSKHFFFKNPVYKYTQVKIGQYLRFAKINNFVE